MYSENFLFQLSQVFTDMVNKCASDFTDEDIEKVLPLLITLSDNGYYEASLILSLYYDPNGCLFANTKKQLKDKSLEVAIKFYRITYNLSKNDKSLRGAEVCRFVEEFLIKTNLKR